MPQTPMPPPSDSTPLLPPFSSSQNSQKSDLTSSSSENTSVPSLTPHYNTVHLLPHFPSPDAYHANPFDPTQAAAPRGSSRGTSIHNPPPSHQSKDHSILRSATSRSLADRSSLLSTSSTLGRSVVLASHDLSLSLRPFEPLSTMPLYSFLLFLLSLPAPSRLILLADLLLSSLHLYSFRACLPSLELFFASVAPSSKTHYLRNVAFMLPPVFLSFMLRFSHFSLVLLLLTNTYYATPHLLTVAPFFAVPVAAISLLFHPPLTPLLFPLALLPLYLRVLPFLSAGASFALLQSTLGIACLLHVLTTSTPLLSTLSKHPPTLLFAVSFVLRYAPLPAYLLLLLPLFPIASTLNLLRTTTAHAHKLSPSRPVLVLLHQRRLLSVFLALSFVSYAPLAYAVVNRSFVVPALNIVCVFLYVLMILSSRLNNSYALGLGSHEGAEPNQETWLGNHRIVPYITPDELKFVEGKGWGTRRKRGRVWMEGLGWGMRVVLSNTK